MTAKIKLRLDDPHTRAVWETCLAAKEEVASWPAWKRGETVNIGDMGPLGMEIEEYQAEQARKHYTKMAETKPAVPFEEWPKIQRYRKVRAQVTEKIDGTNAQIYIPDEASEPVLAGSRNRWLQPTAIGGKSADNFDFAAFVHANSEALRRLGPGRHYGEWYGAGIGRRYGLTSRRFALFNVDRYAKTGLPEGLPAEVELVPKLYDGEMDPKAIDDIIFRLYNTGSVAVPGFMNPEGVVIMIGGGPGAMRLKVTDGNDAPKWKIAAQEAKGENAGA